jgi:hypothetical protein
MLDFFSLKCVKTKICYDFAAAIKMPEKKSYIND